MLKVQCIKIIGRAKRKFCRIAKQQKRLKFQLLKKCFKASQSGATRKKIS